MPAPVGASALPLPTPPPLPPPPPPPTPFAYEAVEAVSTNVRTTAKNLKYLFTVLSKMDIAQCASGTSLFDGTLRQDPHMIDMDQLLDMQTT
jgi:hypothetical protein